MDSRIKCPECGAPMVKRIARSGRFEGETFWGCSRFPSCKGIVNINESGRPDTRSYKAESLQPEILSRIENGVNVNIELVKKLYNLRDELKEEKAKLEGKRPLICTDDALIAIAELMPRNREDLQGIPKVGDVFIDSYGELFTEVVDEYLQTEAEKSVELTDDLDKIMHAMANKLVNINRRNRLLYMPKVANKYGVDCFVNNAKIIDIIYGKNKSYSIINDLTNEPSSNRQYKKTVQLLREVEKDLRDKGHNDLYIGYPFVIGRLAGEDFDVRCPLALFPVKADKSPQRITLAMDVSREIVYNNTLILSYLKYNNINVDLPDEEIDEYDDNNRFITEILTHYKEIGIDIQNKKEGIVPFKEYKSEEFPLFHQGELFLEECAVLGKFPIRDNSIHRDFDKIIDLGEINTLLAQLLSDSYDLNLIDDSVSDEYEFDDNGKLDISEKSLVYINDLNSSQEKVLSTIEDVKGLVVQGPPGTGKSQTITSLIVDYACKGKNVLMVSEKKTALDVVYSRLGGLSQFALMIDDTNNKELFYKQLASMIELQSGDIIEYNYDQISSEIDEIIEKLEHIASSIFSVDESFKIEPYKVYRDNAGVREHSSDEVFVDINENIKSEILSFDYSELNRIRKLFEKSDITQKLNEFYNINATHPVANNYFNNLSSFDILKCKKKLEESRCAIQKWEKKNVISRLFGKTKLLSLLSTTASPYIEQSKVNDISIELLNNIDDYLDACDVYTRLQELRPTAKVLDENQKLYFELLRLLQKKTKRNINELNQIMYNYVLLYYLEKFESENRDVLSYIDSFDEMIKDITENIGKKKEIVRKRLEQVLSNEMSQLNTAKRSGEIKRKIESKRKWSVNKFLNKFNFEIFNSIHIWLLTPEVVSEIMPLRKGLFDLVVFDEASQMYTEKGVPSIFRGKKVVVAGDQKQLRPSNLFSGRVEYDLDKIECEDEEISSAIEEESLLDLARYKYRDVLLNFHYRSDYEELIAFSNHAFYKGRLYVSPNVNNEEGPPIEVHKLQDGMWVNRSNLAEAKYVVKLLKDFFKTRTTGETIGVITFNITQRALIEDMIDEEMAKDKAFANHIKAEENRRRNEEDIGLFIKNIENVQGDERDVIIFSIGYAKNAKGRIVRNFGWLNQTGGENRLNVAISRAKKKIHIVTSIYPSELQVEDIKNNGPRILKKYLEYSFAVSNCDKDAAKQVLYSFGDDPTPGASITFDSPFEEEVYDKLVSCGYEVDTQVGIGGYSIDMAIRHGNRYILGIECDGRLYHSGAVARERDFHRQKYLESRGWTIHRIWSTNWWKDSQTEIHKIQRSVDALIKMAVDDDSSEKENNSSGFKNKKKTFDKKTARTTKVTTSNNSTMKEQTTKKKCDNCKSYKKGDCAGLKVCSEYTPVPQM